MGRYGGKGVGREGEKWKGKEAERRDLVRGGGTRKRKERSEGGQH